MGHSQSKDYQLVKGLKARTARGSVLTGVSIALTTRPGEHCGRRGRQNVRVGDGEDRYGILFSRNGMVTAIMTHSSGAHLWKTLHMTSRGERESENSSE